MKRFAAVFVGALGLGALLRRSRKPAPAEPVPADTDSLAEELRAKLAESRAAVEEPVVDEPADIDARRRDVHDRARQALDELG
jgi:hypothetical protein